MRGELLPAQKNRSEFWLIGQSAPERRREDRPVQDGLLLRDNPSFRAERRILREATMIAGTRPIGSIDSKGNLG